MTLTRFMVAALVILVAGPAWAGSRGKVADDTSGPKYIVTAPPQAAPGSLATAPSLPVTFETENPVRFATTSSREGTPGSLAAAASVPVALETVNPVQLVATPRAGTPGSLAAAAVR